MAVELTKEIMSGRVNSNHLTSHPDEVAKGMVNSYPVFSACLSNNLTNSLNMCFNVLRKPTFSTELYGCPVRLRYHTPFFWQYVDIISGVHGRGGNMSVLLLEPAGRESSAQT